MKTKIVLWGENEKDDKVLLGIELLDANDTIRINIIPENDATEVFYNQMMNQWREGKAIELPASTEKWDRPLSMTESLLPDNLKTQRQDILARAKTEWHFVILSSKLYQSYNDEIDQIKERVDELSAFDNSIWEEMKAFWEKVQAQVREKNLFREHAAELRTKTNNLFESLKSLKKAMNDEFEKASKDNYDQFIGKLKDIEERIEKGLGLKPIFNELKNLQGSFKDVKLTRRHHNDVWKRLDGAFKLVKEKRFGGEAGKANNAVTRISRRYEGLLGAIEKMQRSIDRDVKDKKFQMKRIDTTDGQLELQIRQAKMAMIEERISSKQVKMDDMQKTKLELEKKIELENKKAAKLKEKAEHKKQVKKAADEIKSDIAKGIEEKSQELKLQEEKLQKAAENIKAAKLKRAKKQEEKIAAEQAPAKDKVVAPEVSGESDAVVLTEKSDAEGVKTEAAESVVAAIVTPPVTEDKAAVQNILGGSSEEKVGEEE